MSALGWDQIVARVLMVVLGLILVYAGYLAVVIVRRRLGAALRWNAMLTDWELVREALRTRSIGHEWVHPGECHISASDFPEEGFPTYCPKCDYATRDLPKPRCPECGAAIERGRLLVEQYVFGSAGELYDREHKTRGAARTWRHLTQWIVVLAAPPIAVFFALHTVFRLAVLQNLRFPPWVLATAAWLFCSALAGVVGFLAAWIAGVGKSPVDREKREAFMKKRERIIAALRARLGLSEEPPG